jgi:hypothetical protein
MSQERQRASISSMQFLKLTCTICIKHKQNIGAVDWYRSQLRRFRPSAKYSIQVSLFPLESSAGDIAIPHVGEGHHRCLFSPGRDLTNSDTSQATLQTYIHMYEFTIRSRMSNSALSQIQLLNFTVVHLLEFGPFSLHQTHARYATVCPSPYLAVVPATSPRLSILSLLFLL